MLLALVALFTIVDRLSRPWVGTLALSLALGGDLRRQRRQRPSPDRERHPRPRPGAIEWGPTHPDAIAMFDAVERLTEPDDIVAAPKARAMELETGRPSIQVDDYRPIPPDVDISLIVAERTSSIVNELLNSPDQYKRSGRTQGSCSSSRC